LSRYVLKLIRQIAVYELTGKERTVDAESEAGLNLKVREFLADEFPGEVAPLDMEVEVKKVGESVVDKPIPDEFQPKNKGKFNPGPAPF
jgi:hypothetical protein